MKKFILLLAVTVHGWSLTLSPPIDISDIFICTRVDAAMNEDGIAALVWTDYNLHNKYLYFSCRESGEWINPQIIGSAPSSEFDENFHSAFCRIDPNGTIRIFWKDDSQIFFSERMGDFFCMPQIFWKGEFSKFSVDIHGNLLVYQVDRDIDLTKVMLIEKQLHSSKEKVTTVAEFKGTYVNIEFNEHDYEPENGVCSISVIENENSFGRAVWDTESNTNISGPIENSVHYKVSVDEKKNALVVWKDDGTNVLYASYKPYQEPWTPFVEMATLSKGLGGYVLPFDIRCAAGTFFLLWQKEQNGRYCSVHGATFIIEDQKWSLPMQLSPLGANSYFQSLSLNSKGQGVISWLTEKPELSQTFLQIVEMDLTK